MITDNQTLKLMLIEMSSFFHSVCFCGCRHVYSGNHEAVGRNRTAVCTLTNTTFIYFSNGVSTDTKHVLLDFDSGLMRIKMHGTTGVNPVRTLVDVCVRPQLSVSQHRMIKSKRS